ncbi:hypothetical protein HDU67_006935 [Dinochytrium kinnereticum]|nr:hypothetical protein HDU67_006935 [Dinochytrium kinnereticum]
MVASGLFRLPILFLLVLALSVLQAAANPDPKIDPNSEQGKKIIAAAEAAKAAGQDVVFRGVTPSNLATLQKGEGFSATAKGDEAGRASMVEHVGDDKKPSEHSSTSRDILQALEYADPTRGVVMVDLKKAKNEYADLTTEAGRNKAFGANKGFTSADADLRQYPKNIADEKMKTTAQLEQNQIARAHANSARDKEVLVKGTVAQDACTILTRRDGSRLYRRSACSRRVSAMNKQFGATKVMNADGTLNVKATLAAAKKTKVSLAKTNAERIAGGKKALNFKDKAPASKWVTNAKGEYVRAGGNPLGGKQTGALGLKGGIPPPPPPPGSKGGIPPPPPPPGSKGGIRAPQGKSASKGLVGKNAMKKSPSGKMSAAKGLLRLGGKTAPARKGFAGKGFVKKGPAGKSLGRISGKTALNKRPFGKGFSGKRLAQKGLAKKGPAGKGLARLGGKTSNLGGQRRPVGKGFAGKGNAKKGPATKNAGRGALKQPARKSTAKAGLRRPVKTSAPKRLAPKNKAPKRAVSKAAVRRPKAKVASKRAVSKAAVRRPKAKAASKRAVSKAAVRRPKAKPAPKRAAAKRAAPKPKPAQRSKPAAKGGKRK